MINSAPFSSLQYDDKEHHFLPPRSRNFSGFTSSGKKTIEILVSHHRPDWFENDSKGSIDRFQKEVASICFYGHDHNPEQYEIVIKDEDVIISKGGELKVGNRKLVGSFNQIVFDESSSECICSSFVWSYNFGFFEEKHRSSYPIRSSDPKQIEHGFLTNILNPVVIDEIHENDLFVMPFLRANGNQDNIDSFEKLVGFIEKEKHAFFFGYSNSGKSFLLHRLFEWFSKSEWCVLLTCGSQISGSPKRNIETAFCDEYKYHDEEVVSNFLLSSKTNGVIILDDFDLIRTEKTRKDYIDYCTANFSIVLVSCSNSIVPGAKRFDSNFFDSNHSFFVSGFSLKKRIQLYKNVAKLCGISDEDNASLLIKSSEASIALSSMVDMTEPGCLVDLACEIAKKKLFLKRNTSSAFSMVFIIQFRNQFLKPLLQIASMIFITFYHHLLFCWYLQNTTFILTFRTFPTQ